MALHAVGAQVLIFAALKTEHRRGLALPNTLAVFSGQGLGPWCFMVSCGSGGQLS